MNKLTFLFIVALFFAGGIYGANGDEVKSEPAHHDNYTIPGMPQQVFELVGNHPGGMLHEISFASSYGNTLGYVIAPRGKVDSSRRWIWISPLWIALKSDYGNWTGKYYVDGALAAGFHVVGVDVGTTCGSPKARMIGISNGGLITYGYAFRYPQHVERILGIYPATDFTSWPGLNLVAGPGSFLPAGLAYDLTYQEMQARITEFNPIDNFRPLAKAGVEIFHLHGDEDTLVPLDPNSSVVVERYRAMGGDIALETFEGSIHGGMEFFEYGPALEFLLADIIESSSNYFITR